MARRAHSAMNRLAEIATFSEPTAPVPGMGWLFVADPDGNWVELVGPL